MERSVSTRSSACGGSSIREIEEESLVSFGYEEEEEEEEEEENEEEEEEEEDDEEEEEEEVVYVAVKKELKEGKSTLLWVLQNISREKKKIVICHVHVPSKMIPMMGSKFPADQQVRVVKEYRDHEREKMHKSLHDYIMVCKELKTRAEKLVIEAEDVAKGLIDLVALNGITELVMGASADKHYSRKMKAPKSKTALTVKQHTDPSCRIWFVCKGNLICSREALLDTSRISSRSTSIAISSSSQSEHMQSRSLPQGQAESSRHGCHNPDLYRTSSSSPVSQGGLVAALRQTPPVRALDPRSRFSSEGGLTIDLTVDPWDGISSRASRSLNYSLSSASDDTLSNMDYLSIYKDEENTERSVMQPLVQGSDADTEFSSLQIELEDGVDAEVYDRVQEAITEAENLRHEAYRESLRRQTAENKAIEALKMEDGVDAEVYDRLQEDITEAENLRHEAYRESLRRQTAEKKAIEALERAKASERLHAKEVDQRKDIEEALAREKMEVETIKKQRDDSIEQCQMASIQKQELELRIADSYSTVKDLEEKLLVSQHLFDALQVEHEELQLQQDAEIRVVEELSQKKEPGTTSTHGLTYFSEFSYVEIEKATCNFSSSLKIGEGGYGSVYKGFLRNTVVAIKMLNPQGMQGQSEFHQEVNVLGKVRHPNLVTLIGACPEAWALIYEFLPGGSLDDRLDCKNNTSPLTWQTRTRIATEICSSLIFLHSNKPYPVVHGDLKPDNILLDANLVSKLSDFGICRLLIQSSTTSTLFHYTNPKGTFAYIDPEFLATGELTPQSDVYSFGIILLQLLTGKLAVGLLKDVKDVLDWGLLHVMIDPSAGEWPFVQAKQLAHLGLRCCEMHRKNRPDLVQEVWRVLMPMLKATSSSVSALSFGSISEDNSLIPNYFICPIFQVTSPKCSLELCGNPNLILDIVS